MNGKMMVMMAAVALGAVQAFGGGIDRQMLKDLIALPSVNRNPKELRRGVEFLKDWLEKRKVCCAVETNECGYLGLYASTTPGKVHDYLFVAHVDVVKAPPEMFVPRVEGDRIYGLGSNDCGGSLVALLAAFAELRTRPQPYRLIFCATAEEENTGPEGLNMLLAHIPTPALGIIGEPTGMQMAVAEKGLIVLDCTSRGVSGHAAREEGVNALYKALDDIGWFRTYAFDKVSPFLGPVRMTVTQIRCGTQHNVVPDECSFVVDVRPNGLYTNEAILDIIRGHVGCEVRPRSLKHRSSSISTDHPVVLRGLSLGLEPYGSPTASNRICCNFPTLKIGPGQSSRSHMADEYILTSEIENAVGLYIRLLDGLAL